MNASLDDGQAPPAGHRLKVVDTLSGESWAVALDRAELSIGRPAENRADPDVVLSHPLVSRAVHARLSWRERRWWLEHKGLHETLLDGESLARNRSCPLSAEQEIRIAHYVLRLQGAAAGVDGESTPLRQPEQLLENAGRRLMELEMWVHAELLAIMDRRRVDAVADLSSREAREQIRGYLDDLTEQALLRLSDGEFAQLLSVAVYRRLSLRITVAGGALAEDMETETETETEIEIDAGSEIENVAAGFAYRGLLDELEQRIAGELGVSFDAKRMETDAAALERGFETAFTRFALEITPGLRDYLVSQLVKRDLWDLIFGLGPIQDFMDMDCVSEIMVVSRERIFVEKFGVVEDSRRAFFSDDSLLSVIERIVGPAGRRVDRSSPLADARLADGSRVNVVIPPLAVKGPCITIRKFATIPLEIEDLIARNSLAGAMARFLEGCILGRRNIIVSGGTGTGKTTLLNCLSRFIPHKERIVSIEDTAELQLKQQHVVTLEARPPNMEGRGGVTIQDLVRNALRMRPDRIVVGECRGPEALDMLQAMNTGHDGSLTTGHANSPHDMMLRLESMVLTGTEIPVSAIREQIAAAFDLVVQLRRFADGARRVVSIAEVVGIDELSGEVLVEDIFVYRPDAVGGYYAHTGYIPSFVEELLRRGAITLESFF